MQFWTETIPDFLLFATNPTKDSAICRLHRDGHSWEKVFGGNTHSIGDKFFLELPSRHTWFTGAGTSDGAQVAWRNREKCSACIESQFPSCRPTASGRREQTKCVGWPSPVRRFLNPLDVQQLLTFDMLASCRVPPEGSSTAGTSLRMLKCGIAGA